MEDSALCTGDILIRDDHRKRAPTSWTAFFVTAQGHSTWEQPLFDLLSNNASLHTSRNILLPDWSHAGWTRL